MKKFFSGLLVTILVVIILGGLGYIGYSMLSGGHSGHNMNTANNTAQNQTGTQGSNSSQGSMNMQGDSMNMQGQSSGSQSTLQQVNYALQNKESIDKTISMLDDVVKSAMMESNSSNNTVNNPNTQQNNNIQQPNNVPGVPANTQGNTTVNIYPNTQQGGAVNNNTANMGITYDYAKMEQFHTGLYKLTAGIENLKQVEEDLMKQAEQAAVDVQDKTAYYTNQYNMTLQSKSRLNQALYDINEASNLLNINPYLSSNGVVYDKDRMQQMHGNILKLSQSVTTLNKLSSDMTRQAVTLIGTAQSYANGSSMDMSSMNMPGMSSINMSSIVNILLIVFAVVFVIGLLGFISSLFKPSALEVNR